LENYKCSYFEFSKLLAEQTESSGKNTLKIEMKLLLRKPSDEISFFSPVYKRARPASEQVLFETVLS